MKTKSLFWYALKYAAYCFVFFWTILSANAQCPTINDPNPIICDASGYTLSDLSVDYATDTGGGIVWYSVLTGGIPLSSAQLVSEGTYYADNTSGSCSGSRQSIVVDFQVNKSGQNLDGIYCSNENATVQTYIDDVLSPNIPLGGSVEVYNDFNLTDLASTLDLLPAGANNYFIVFVDNLGCKSQTEIGTTAIFSAPTDPTPTTPQLFCSDANPTIADLDAGTLASVTWYQNIDGSGNPILPALSLSTALVNGNTYYVQVDGVFCNSHAIPVTVTIDDPNEPGLSGSLEYCQDSIPISDFDLFNELGGAPDTTGIWAGPLTTSNGFQGTVNISTLTTPGVYTFIYTVPSNGVCPESSANVVITIYETFTSGIVSAINPASFCESGLPTSFDLFSLIENEDLNGQWTEGTLSSDPIITSPIDLSTLTPGTYNFTYTQNLLPNPCPEESTTVQVIVLADPNAGLAVNQTFCENDLLANSPFDLFNALDGSQDNNTGTWTDSNSTIISNNLDITTLTVAGSPYQFTYTLSNGICEDTETISIIVEPAPESGNALAPFEVCEEDTAANSPFDLFSLLDGTQDTNGTWYQGTDTSGTIVTNSIDLTGFADGTYNYTYSVPAIGSCTDVDVTVQIIVNPQPNTGTPSTAVICENDLAANSPLDLFGQLSGNDIGGTWSDNNSTGALTGSNVDLTLLTTVGSYNFTYSITSPNGCSNNSTVVVTIVPAPDSGTINPPAEFCITEISTAQTFDLFTLLEGENQSGVWSDDDSTGALSGNLLTLDGLSAGTYNFTYDVNAIGSCDDVLVTVSVIINDTPAPAASSPQEFCDSALVSDLLATGTDIKWYDVASGGTPLADTTPLVDGQIYYASQTIDCESSIRASVTATIYQSPNSGNPSLTPITACDNNSAIDLFSGLDGTQDLGGVWQDTDATGALTENIFDASGISPGTYQFTYYVTANAPCIDSSTTISVTIETPLSAGTDNVLEVCSTDITTDLFSLIGSANIGGTWSPALTSGTGIFDPLVDASGTYTYTVTNACGTDSSNVVVTVTQAPNAGTGNNISICVIDGTIDLFTQLGGTPDIGGTWSPVLTSGTGVFDPLVDAPGVYTYLVASTLPCRADATSQITVTVNDSSAPVVVDPNPTFCLVDNPTVADLDASLSATGTITWYSDAALTTVLNSTDVLIDGQDYFATQTNSSGCESSQNVQVSVTVNDSSTPTLIDSNQELCINDNPTIMDLMLNISEYDSNLNNIIWYDTATGGTPLSSSLILSNGVTYYASLFNATTGCESSVRLAVNPDLTSCGKIVLPDGFSPNGDGVNDTYSYNNLEILYPKFEIEIFNRYGNVVYKGTAATPRFDGTSNQSGLGNGKLPVGVYFYIFKFNDGQNKPEQGRLYLSR
ncbi:MAG: gliding motility-associated C-terminal domain-containing protein [Flavobacteriaceae bacterium]|nr:gliding motility-associated C-terminal domain-containing protein [Flavobacteriaceae bacterium]